MQKVMSTGSVFLIVIIPFIAFFLINGRMQLLAEISLLKYIEQHYKTLWDYLTSSGSYNPRYINGFTPRMIKFLVSKEENKDDELLSLKRKLKKHWFYGLMSIIAIPFILIFILITRILLTLNH